MKYTFGTDTKAADRLEIIAKFFNPLASKFIKNFLTGKENSVVDIGCGPGFTTDMLSKIIYYSDVYGLDKSNEFLVQAAARFDQCKFIEHDITQIPFPLKADFMYTRFLLTHLQDSSSIVNSWTTQLNKGGTLIIEELEDIETKNDLFTTYLTMSEKMVAAQGAILYVGKELANKNYDADLLYNECITLPVANCQAASWFFPNTETVWKQNDAVLKYLSLSQIRAISDELLTIVNSGDINSDITWKMRRLVLNKH